MKVIYLVLIVQVGAQLACDKTIIHSTVGRTFSIICKYNYRQYLFSKKYWCLGESRTTCEVLMDTDGFIMPRIRYRAMIRDVHLGEINIVMKLLELEDTGVYWVGISKIYTDIMLKIQVHVKEEVVSLPMVQSVGSPHLTCLGQAVILRCKAERGTNVKYSWLKEINSQVFLIQSSPDLPLTCNLLTESAKLVCLAWNLVSQKHSKSISLHLLQAGSENCSYSLTSDNLQSYDCTIITALTTTTTNTRSVDALTLQSQCVPQSYSKGNHSVFKNPSQNWKESFLFRSWSGVPVWYDIVRWVLFTAMISTLITVHVCMLTTCCGSRLLHKHKNHRGL